jgi:glycosidase
LLVTGENLSDASLIAPPGFRVGEGRVSQNGEYLFVDLHIPVGAELGALPLRVVNEQGEAPVAFELLPALSRQGRSRGFSTDDVIYLIMTDRFANGDASNDDPATSPGLLNRSKPRHYHGGDLQGVIDRLDYLERLGVTAVWLTPWYDNSDELNHSEKYTSDNKLSENGTPSTDYHGYGAVDFYAVEEHFGDLGLLREFVSKAQARGIRVVQDQVANHTGPSHRWVTNPPTPTWFNGSASNHLANSWQTWTTATPDPPPDQLRSTLEGWFIDILPDLNQNDPEVAVYLIQNSLWWLGVTGVDAVRQDTLPYVPRRYWAQWTGALKREYPDVTILGELFDGDPNVVAFFQGGRKQFDGIDSGVDTLFDFPLHYAIRDVFVKRQPMTRLTDTLAADTNYVDASVLVTFLGLHDKPRFLHESGATVEGLKLAFTFMLTTRGTPLVYYGDEIGMNGGRDPENRRDFPGGWPEDPRNAFEPSGRTARQRAVHDHVARLLALRRELEPLRQGSMVNLSAGPDTYAFARSTSDAFVVVALNNSLQPQPIELSIADLTRQPIQYMTDRLGGLGALGVIDGTLDFHLPPQSAVVLTPGPVLADARETKDESAEGASPRRSQTGP